MTTSSKYGTVARPDVHNNWSFLPTAFSALTGVVIGMAIGSYLGWL